MPVGSEEFYQSFVKPKSQGVGDKDAQILELMQRARQERLAQMQAADQETAATQANVGKTLASGITSGVDSYFDEKAAQKKAKLEADKWSSEESYKQGDLDIKQKDFDLKKESAPFENELKKAQTAKTLAEANASKTPVVRGALEPKDIAKAKQDAGDALGRATTNYTDAIDAATQAETLVDLARTNPTAAGAAIRKLARAAGDKGVLSDADAAAFGGSQALKASFDRLAEKAENGTMTPEDAKNASEVARIMKVNSQKAYDKLVDESVNRFSLNYGITPEEAYASLTGRKKVAKPTAGVTDIKDDELDKIYNSLPDQYKK